MPPETIVEEVEEQQQQATLQSRPVTFQEALTINEDGTINVCIITPGWGNSGYYSEDMLKNAISVFTQGLHMYWDHPTASEEWQRPERSLRDLAGVLAEDAEWDDNGFAGPGIYSTSKVFSPYMDHLGEMAPHIGVSVIVFAMAHKGEIDGTTGEIIDKIVAARSADFVTLPARGGKVQAKFESLKEDQRIKIIRESLSGTPRAREEEDAVDEATATALKAENEELKKQLADVTKERDDLQTESSRQSEAIAISEAGKLVAAELSDVQGMPDITKERLTRTLAQNPVIADGKLDRDEMKKKVTEAVEEEAKYLSSLGFGEVKDNGPSVTPGDNGDAKTRVKSAFESLGLRDKKLDVATEGR